MVSIRFGFVFILHKAFCGSRGTCRRCASPRRGPDYASVRRGGPEPAQDRRISVKSIAHFEGRLRSVNGGRRECRAVLRRRLGTCRWHKATGGVKAPPPAT